MEELSEANLRSLQATEAEWPTFVLWNDLPPLAGSRAAMLVLD